MADLPSILGGMAQGFLDFGKSAVDLFGTGGAAVGDLVDTIRTGKVSTKNQDDFRKWLYNTDSVQDAAAKGLGTALNGVQTVSDYIPGIGAVTRNPLFNAGQGALGGLADEFKTYGKDYDLGRAGQRAAVSAGAALASGSLGDALKKSANPLLSSGAVQGLARGATSGAISGGGYAAIDGGDIAQSALQGAGTGALIGGATGAIQDFMPRKATYDMALTDEEKAARIANAKNMLANEQNPERIAELNNQIKDLGGTLADADMAVNSPRYLTDENGNPRTFYHGSPNKNITEFDINQAGKNTRSGERALYFTDSPEVADEFSYERIPTDDLFVENRGAKGRVYPVNLEMNNPLDLDNLTDAQIDELWPYASYMGSWQGKDVFTRDLKNWRDVNNAQLIKGYLDMDKLASSPYDGFMARMYPNQDNQAREYAVFDNSKVKMLEDVLAADDAAINSPKLTPEQEAYFKDSVVRDENGNLMPLYHGSNSKFTVFDSSKGGQSNKSAKVGHWFTPSKEGAEKWAGRAWWGDNDPTVYETYLNIKKPMVYEPIDNSAQIKKLETQLKQVEDRLNSTYRGSQEYYDAYKEYNNIADEIDNLSYTDPYEQFRSHIYAMEGKTPSQANVGGVGMVMNDEDAAVQKYVDMLKSEGYDGIIIKGTGYDQNVMGGPNDQYVVFDSNQIKNTNNLKPTDNPDIRYSKAALGQSLEKTLANGDAEINRIGSADVAPVNPKTLPKSLQAAQEYLNESNYINDIEKFAGKPYPKLTNQDFLEYSLSLKNPKDKEFFRTIIDDMVNDGSTTYEKYASAVARNKRLEKLMKSSFDDMDAESLGRYLANNRTKLNNGTIKDIDAELSDRLGIGRSNTLMRDNYLPQDALGAYDPTNSTISIDTNAPEENLVNTLAHERLHSFQTEGDFKRYDKRVTDAYEELSKDLNKYLKTPEETAKRYAFDADYWGNEREQQSRMLQQYLENKGFTRGGLQETNVGEWGNEINPAFDKFFDKLRDLSKRGVALPALTALFGGGAYMASQNNDKEKEVK